MSPFNINFVQIIAATGDSASNNTSMFKHFIRKLKTHCALIYSDVTAEHLQVRCGAHALNCAAKACMSVLESGAIQKVCH